MSGRSGVGTELSNASASARRRAKVSALSSTCGHSASASRNSGSTSSIVLMVANRVRLGRSKAVWQGLPGDKSAWISHIDEQAECGRRAGDHPWWPRQQHFRRRVCPDSTGNAPPGSRSAICTRIAAIPGLRLMCKGGGVPVIVYSLIRQPGTGHALRHPDAKKLPEPGYYYHFKHDPSGPLNNYAYYIYGVGHHTED